MNFLILVVEVTVKLEVIVVYYLVVIYIFEYLHIILLPDLSIDFVCDGDE